MSGLFHSGVIAYIAIGVLLAESATLAVVRRRMFRGPRLASILANGASGIGLLMALHAALVHAAWPIIALWLALALIAHAGDVVIRWTPSSA